MKTTNFEISKKLAEIGFRADSDFSWNKQIIYCGNSSKEHIFKKYNNGWAEGEELFKSYDLETILENISFVVQDLEKDKNYWFAMNQQELGYMSFDGETNIDFYTPRQKDESLADTAVRLLIKLHEKGLVKFGGENDI